MIWRLAFGAIGVALFLIGAYVPMRLWYTEGAPPNLFIGLWVHGTLAVGAGYGMWIVRESIK